MLNVLNSKKFYDVHNCLLKIWSDCIEIYTDEFLKDVSSAKVASGATAYFLTVDVGVGVRMHGLLSSILAELQAVALVL
ncbi:hypothetical protein G9A89_022687, partial [Geosiphon pyriformis]